MLFRPESIQAQTDRLHGDILLARSLSAWIFATIAIAIAGTLLLVLFFGHYAKRNTAIGLLVPTTGAMKIVSPTGGMVVERHVSEGQYVRKGAVLSVLADERRLGDATGERLVDALARSLEERRRSLMRERESVTALSRQSLHAIGRRIEQLRAESIQAEREIALANLRIEYGRKDLSRRQRLASAHFLSDQSVQQKEEELADAETRLVNAQRGQSALLRDIAAAEDESRQVPVGACQASCRLIQITKSVYQRSDFGLRLRLIRARG